MRGGLQIHFHLPFKMRPQLRDQRGACRLKERERERERE